MRSQKIMLLLGLAVLVGASLFLFGCSDDETPTNSNGDFNDPEFVQAYDQLNEFVDSTLYAFSDGLGTMYTLSADTTVDPIQYGGQIVDAQTVLDISVLGHRNGTGFFGNDDHDRIAHFGQADGSPVA